MQLSAFIPEVKGRGYSLNLSKLWRGRKHAAAGEDVSPVAAPASPTPPHAPSAKGAPSGLPSSSGKGFFCSELVCVAYLKAGLVRPYTEPAAFWPGCFATGGAIADFLLPGVSLEKEVVVDTREMSVQSAVNNL